MQHYQIENSEALGKQMRCPHCGEMLSPVDVENFSVCPFCNAILEQNGEFEDFVLDPLVRRWIRHAWIPGSGE